MVEVEMLAGDACYADVPVTRRGKKATWVDPTTRVLKYHSTPAPCNVHFPLVMQSNDLYVELPSLRTVTPPMNQTLLLPTNPNGEEFTDLAKGGLYTKAEISAWEDLLAFPAYHKALQLSISLGSCIHQDMCNPVTGQAAYDLGNMETFSHWDSPLTWMRKQIETYGGGCAILMLLYVVIRLFVDIILMTLIAMRDGPAAVLALLVELYASNTLTYQRIRKRHQRQRARKKRESSHLEEGGPSAKYRAHSPEEGVLLSLAPPEGE